MRGPRRRVALVAAPLLLASSLVGACSDGGGGEAGSVSADEARQLNEAAEMLDANSVDLNAVANDQDP